MPKTEGAKAETMVRIDGSFGEGGGQILRNRHWGTWTTNFSITICLSEPVLFPKVRYQPKTSVGKRGRPKPLGVKI